MACTAKGSQEQRLIVVLSVVVVVAVDAGVVWNKKQGPKPYKHPRHTSVTHSPGHASVTCALPGAIRRRPFTNHLEHCAL